MTRASVGAVTLVLPEDRIGVLPCQYLEQAIAARVIDAGRFTIPRPLFGARTYSN